MPNLITLVWSIMNIDLDLLKKFNIYHQYLQTLKNQIVYHKMKKGAKNELEKPINKL